MVIVNVILCLALISFFLSALVFCSTKTAPLNKTMKKSVVNCNPHFHIWVRLIFLPVLATSQKKEKGKKTQLMKQNFLKRSKTKSQVLPQCCTMQAALSPADLQCQMKSTRMQLFNIKKLDLWKPTFFVSLHPVSGLHFHSAVILPNKGIFDKVLFIVIVFPVSHPA